MAKNKIVYNGNTLIDLTGDTVTANSLLEGYTAHDRTGEIIIGTASGGSGDGYVWQDGDGYVHLSDEEGTQISVQQLNVNASGTYTAPSGTAYSPVVVPSGTAGTPTATKGTVSNHSVSVTPSVTNSAGFISGGSKTGTSVSISASELVSGTKSISSNGTGIDVTNYASVDVAVPTGSATLVTKNITANGTYNASSDNADGYSSVTVNVSGGGGDTWTWMGRNPTKVQTALSEKVYLKDTDYATWTPSTTATVLIDTYNLNGVSANINENDYYVILRFHTHLEYLSPDQTSAITEYYTTNTYSLYGYYSTLTQITNDTCASGSGSVANRTGVFYINSSGSQAFSSSAPYGVYVGSWSGANYGSNTLTPKTPTINVRCNNSYFSTASAEDVNQNTSYYEIIMEIWKMDRQTSVQGANAKNIRDMWLAGDII